MGAVARFFGSVAFLAVTLAATLLPQGIWSALLALNLRTGLSLPWSAGAALLMVLLCWRWAGGEWPWPRSQAARRLRRAHGVSAPLFAWALVANAFAIVALASLWLLLENFMP